jgi:hypothetical protein
MKLKNKISKLNKEHPSKCRGKVQKMGVLYTHHPKMPGPSPNFLRIPKLIIFLK